MYICAMDTKEYEALKANFLRIIANVPGPLREEIIAVVGDKTFTWITANAEIKKDTKEAHVILENLKKTGVL